MENNPTTIFEEERIYTGRGVVYFFSPTKKEWEAPLRGKYSYIFVYYGASKGYRVVARGTEEEKNVQIFLSSFLITRQVILINSWLVKNTPVALATDIFCKWTDPKSIYGVQFATKGRN